MSAAAEMVQEYIRVADGERTFVEAWSDGWRVPDPMPVDEWADKYRVLAKESSSEPGPWRTDRVPFAREPMRVLSDDHPCKRVVMMYATQITKTETGNNWIASVIHQNPGPMMVVQPTVEMGKRWTRQRFQPMVKLSKPLQGLVATAISRDSTNTTTMKEFPGGFLVIAGSNSAASLASMPVRYLYLDEPDRYPDDVDDEGHPVDVADRRTSSFPRRKVLLTSSPTVKGESVIEDEYELSDQRHYYVPCPHCTHEQVLIDDRLTDDGQFVCEDCGEIIEEHHKTGMLENGRWIAHNPDSDVPGFHLPSYYAPLGLGYSWQEIADMRIAARGNPKKDKTYTNTIMAETYEDESGKVDWQEVKKRAGGYSSRTIPVDCLMITAGIDVQDDRFAIQITGWGRGERTWTIDYFEVPADPALQKDWDKLDDLVLDLVFTNRFGVEMRVLATAIDTGGHHTHMAYKFARTRKHKRVLAVKGSRYPNKPIIAARPSAMDVNINGKKIRAGVDLWFVGTDTAKGAIYAKLHADEGAEPDEYRFNTPGDLTDDYYQQLTAERYDAELGRWVKPRHKRNEVLDCVVYSYAAACHPSVRVHMLRDHDWEKIESIVQPVIKDMFANEPEQETVSHETQEEEKTESTDKPKTNNANRSRKKRGRKGGYVGGWK